MKLYAISDLHLGHRLNREALERISPHPRDWVILAGDIGETEDQLELALSAFARRFARVIWVPGNHELWTTPARDGSGDLRGEAKYRRLVALCRRYGALTPEDAYPVFHGEGGPRRIAPLFLLYDHSFRPDDVPLDRALAWAEEANIVCSDEFMLRPEPHGSTRAWCAARCEETLARLERERDLPLVLVNHFALHESLIRFEHIPRFSLWCGTKRTADWHTRFPVETVVYGHLHMRARDYIDGVRFEEVSLGYPRDWEQELGMEAYLREILPGPPPGEMKSERILKKEWIEAVE
ncbi:MAG: metallophosphoesterase [Byssovorax sp.]